MDHFDGLIDPSVRAVETFEVFLKSICYEVVNTSMQTSLYKELMQE